MQDPRHDQTPHSRTGLEGKEISSPSSQGRKMSLTSPLIDQALTLIHPPAEVNECHPDLSPTIICAAPVTIRGSILLVHSASALDLFKQISSNELRE